jgi:pyrroloquinoline quinone biosynthesis protein E
MTIEQFRYLYSSFPELEWIKIQGIGEPLLNQDLFGMIQHAKRNGSFVMTYTNGSVLHLGDRAKKLLDSGIDVVRISMDGGTRETFQSIRKAEFDQVIENTASLVQLRGNKEKPSIEFWTVGMTHNIRELPAIIDIAREAQVDAVRVQMMMNTFDYKPEVGDRLTGLKLGNADEIQQCLAYSIEYAQRSKVELTLEKSKARSMQRKCHWPFDSAFISVEGYVVPCCTIADPRVVAMGNLFEEPFESIWTGKRYQQFRQAILEHRLPIPCKNCYVSS